MINIVANNSGVTGMPDPEVGMGVTQYFLNDRAAWTVVKIITPQRCVIQRDIVKADPTKPNGMGHQNWLCERNPEGEMMVITKRSDGWWRTLGQDKRHSTRFLIGERHPYHCWEF